MPNSSALLVTILFWAIPGAVRCFSASRLNENRRTAISTTVAGHRSSSSKRNANTMLHETRVVREPEEVMEAGTSVVRRELEVSRHPDPMSQIDFDMPKSRERLSLQRLAQRLDQELFESEWFVTGHVNPKYFHTDFTYQDADVEMYSLEEYARDVHKLFDQSCSRAEILETKVDRDRARTITCTWRCSGRANLLWGVDIKPFMVTTNWQIDKETGLISRQVDEYSLPQWDLLVSAFFPFLNGIITAEPAPPVPTRHRVSHAAATVPRSPLLSWAAKAGFDSYFSRPKRSQPNTGSPLDDFVEFLTEDKNNFFDWVPPTASHNTKTLITPEHPDRLPTIRAPTFWDRMQAYGPNDAKLLENLSEATRRTESRRSRRYYVALEDEEEDDDEDMAEEEQEDKEEAEKAMVHPGVAP